VANPRHLRRPGDNNEIRNAIRMANISLRWLLTCDNDTFAKLLHVPIGLSGTLEA
jgi:hypothetical protein